MRSADGSAGSDADAPAVHAAPAGAHEQRARLADQPDAEAAALHHEAGARVQVARVVADEVAEQPERGASAASPRRAARAHDLRAAVGVQLGDRPGMRERHAATGAATARRRPGSPP